MFRLRFVPDKTNIQFMKGRIAGLVVSAILSIASLILLLHPGLNYGIEFKGGILIEARLPEAANFAALRSALDGLGLGEVQLQQSGETNEVLIRMERQKGDEAAQQKAADLVRATLIAKFPGTQIQRVEVVGATVSAELFWNGMLAMGLALVAMLLYIAFRFQWPFGVAAAATLDLAATKLLCFSPITHRTCTLTSIAPILTA